MFDTVASPAKRRSGTATAGSIGAHGIAIAVAVVLAGMRTAQSPSVREVRVVSPRFAAPQSGARNPTSQPQRTPEQSASKPRPPRLSMSRDVDPARAPPEASVVEPPHGNEPGAEAVDRRAIEDVGVQGGEGSFTPTSPGDTREYEAGRMTPPRQISGPDPEYTPQALQNDVQGLMVVKCIVTVEGAVHSCRVLQGLPFMNRPVVEALERRRYLPARLSDGRPVEVDYTFRIRLQLPQ